MGLKRPWDAHSPICDERVSIWSDSLSSETSNGSDVTMPQPRNERASKPATPPSKRASAAGPPSLYVSSGQSKGRMREVP